MAEARPVVACPRMDAAQALADLTEISAQIEAAVLADHDGSVVASTLADEGVAESVAGGAGARLGPRGQRGAKPSAKPPAELLAAADEVRTEPGSDPLVQIEVAALDGSVFVAKD